MIRPGSVISKNVKHVHYFVYILFCSFSTSARYFNEINRLFHADFEVKIATLVELYNPNS